MLQSAVQAASVPEGVAGDGVGSYLPQRIPAVLENVGRSALVAFGEGSQGSVLFLTQPGITNLDIILVLGLTQTDVGKVGMGLLTQAR